MDVLYLQESGDENNSRVSLTEDQENGELKVTIFNAIALDAYSLNPTKKDIDPDMESNSLMIPATEVREDEEVTPIIAINNCYYYDCESNYHNIITE